MLSGKHHFISYSTKTAQDFALRLHDELEGGTPQYEAWLDKRDIQPSENWDIAIDNAIRDARTALFVMTEDSVSEHSVCYQEWTRALSYKKPVIPILLDPDAQAPFRLHMRQYIDFSGDFAAGIAKLREHLRYLGTPKGQLEELQYRRREAVYRRERTSDKATRQRIQDEIDYLDEQIRSLEQYIHNPDEVIRQTERSIQAGIERERQPEKRPRGRATSKFINQPPAGVPHYFQDRDYETRLVGQFLKNPTQRVMTLVGRGGIGKTALVCRVLKALEDNRLPDDGGRLDANGIVYLSAAGRRPITAFNLYHDLLKLLPPATADELTEAYKNPQVSITAKMEGLLDHFVSGNYVVLLDNFESVMDAASHTITDDELREALEAVLTAPPHGVKLIITTREAPVDLLACQPQHHERYNVGQGLDSPHAENMLRALDSSGQYGLKDAPDDLLGKARRLTRGYPRALEALYGTLLVDTQIKLPELLDEIEQREATQQQPDLPEQVVEAVVGQAFNRLDATAQRVMQALAVYGEPVTTSAVDYLLQPFIPDVNSGPVLRRLVNADFVRHDAGRYALHPVDRAYALSLLEEGEPPSEIERALKIMAISLGLEPPTSETPDFTRYGLYERAADYFRSIRKPRKDWQSVEDLDPQLAEYRLRLEIAGYDTAAAILKDITPKHLLLWGLARQVVELYEPLVGKVQDNFLAMDAWNNLGLAYNRLGQVKAAIEAYEQGLALAREASSKSGQGAFLGNLGVAYSNLGQLERAIDFYKQALEIARESGDRQGERNVLTGLGNAYRALGQVERAIDFYKQALVISRESGDRQGEGADLGNLGNAYSNLGQLERAINFYKQALEIAREVGDRQGEETCLGNLGNCYRVLGQVERAVDFYQQALEISRKSGDRQGEGIGLENLGHALVAQGQLEQAIEYHQQAIHIADEIKYPPVQNSARRGLAIAYLLQDDLEAARQAIEEATVYNVPGNNAAVQVVRGIVARRQGEAQTAEEAFHQAIAHADELLARSAQQYAQWDAKGLALAGLGQWAEARAAFQQARAIMAGAGHVQHVLRLLAQLDGVPPEVRQAAAGDTDEA